MAPERPVVPLQRACRSNRTTRLPLPPCRAREWAMLAPMTPPPMMRISAVSVMAVLLENSLLVVEPYIALISAYQAATEIASNLLESSAQRDETRRRLEDDLIFKHLRLHT